MLIVETRNSMKMYMKFYNFPHFTQRHEFNFLKKCLCSSSLTIQIENRTRNDFCSNSICSHYFLNSYLIFLPCFS